VRTLYHENNKTNGSPQIQSNSSARHFSTRRKIYKNESQKSKDANPNPECPMSPPKAKCPVEMPGITTKEPSSTKRMTEKKNCFERKRNDSNLTRRKFHKRHALSSMGSPTENTTPTGIIGVRYPAGAGVQQSITELGCKSPQKAQGYNSTCCRVKTIIQR
jgi:hypothetical protein